MGLTFAAMFGLKIPKTVVWIVSLAALLFILMSSYRIITHSLFVKEAPGDISLARIMWMGLRFDARYVALVCFPVFVLGLLPGLHLFKSHSGKMIAVWVFSIYAVLLFLIYGFDFACQIHYSKRLDWAAFADFFIGTANGKAFRANVPWVIILLLAGVGSWLFNMLVRFSHHAMGKAKGTDNKTMRLFWQFILALTLLFCFYGRIGSTPLSYSIAEKLGNAQATNSAINPFESLRHSRK